MAKEKSIILETKGLTCYFGGLAAVKDLDFSVVKGPIQGLIGPNGAGKTTMFNLITGFLPPARGKVFLNGEDITNLKPNEIAKRGIARTYQVTRLFRNATVLQNIVIGNHLTAKTGFWSELVTSRQAREEWRQGKGRARELLQWIDLGHKEDSLAMNLPLKEQKVLSIALGLALDPSLLLLDEPTAGLNDEETNEMRMLIQRVKSERGITIVVIEHKMRFVMGLCEHITVLSGGSKLAEGAPEEIKNNREVIRAYLGEVKKGRR